MSYRIWTPLLYTYTCWSELEPEVGIEPTTYRLQDGHSTLSAASTMTTVTMSATMTTADNSM